MQAIPQALAALAHYRQFIVYQTRPKPGNPGKTDKLPVNPGTGRVSSAHDPAAWVDSITAIQTAAAWGEGFGVGFVFTESDPFFFVDIDNCLTTAGQWSPTAVDLMTRLNGAAVEVSQSGRGLHIIGTGRAPGHGCKNQPEGLEFYTAGRFVALTGTNAIGDASVDCTAALPAVVSRYFPATDSIRPATWTAEPVPEYAGPTDDAELIEKARSSGGTAAQVFGGKASFNALWTADPVALARAYPDNYGDRQYDASSADAALAAHLAFWTGCDCERIARLMRQSALVRPKWDRHRSYLQRTILGAVGRCESVYTTRIATTAPESTAEPAQVPTGSGAELVDGFQYLAATQQVDHFAGCVYVQDVHRVFTPKGVLLKPEQFKATYGGYVFALDATNDKVTKNAWEAFTESQAVRYPIAEGMTFRPELEPGDLVTEEGRKLVNTYTPADVDRVPGDVEPFLTHLRKILPDERDALILLSYMAACVQHVGVKFQWAPLLQGTEGNGKTLFTRCVARAVGMQYSHFPKAEEVGSKFNSWMLRKLFIGIEDVYFPDHKREILQALLPLITNDVLPIEMKGVDQISARVCANFMLNTNPKDAIRKTRNDRRFCIFFTAQQSADDLIRDGMGGDYFPDLYDWLKRGGGYAHVSDYLATFNIPDELNPATKCHRAPKTSTTEQAIAHGVGGVEQEIIEAIDEGRPGFAGGWVSSMALDRLIESMRLSRAIPPNRRREIMQGLGYDWHPALNNGRVNNPIALDGGKPKLFVKNTSPDRNIESPGEAARAYEVAQATGGSTIADRVFGAVSSS